MVSWFWHTFEGPHFFSSSLLLSFSFSLFQKMFSFTVGKHCTSSCVSLTKCLADADFEISGINGLTGNEGYSALIAFIKTLEEANVH